METAHKIKPGIYRHFKGGLYRVLGVARHSETLEELVVYQSCVDASQLWVRPLSMWNETVEWDGQKIRRFVPADETEEV